MNPTKTVATLAAGLGVLLAGKALLRQRNRISFAGRSVVITGGSRGLGLVLARLLAAQGARLTLLARDPEELEHARVSLVAQGAEVLTVPCDVRSQPEVEAAIARVIEQYGRIDVLINNAGIIQVGPLDHMQVEDFMDAMSIHAWGPLYTMLAALPQMRQQGEGRIVNISSIGGKVAVPHLLPYSTSKFALTGLSEGMRSELAADNILVTTVCPGLMRTGSHFNAQFKGQRRAEFTWFALGDALPTNSISAQRAARQIIEACRYGRPELIITVQARALVIINALFPGFVARTTALVNRLLPAPTTPEGDASRSGWESRSPLAPSLLTSLADKAAEEHNELRGRSREA